MYLVNKTKMKKILKNLKKNDNKKIIDPFYILDAN